MPEYTQFSHSTWCPKDAQYTLHFDTNEKRGVGSALLYPKEVKRKFKGTQLRKAGRQAFPLSSAHLPLVISLLCRAYELRMAFVFFKDGEQRKNTERTCD